MDRLTRLNVNNQFCVDESSISYVDNEYIGEAINRLATFENIYENLILGQNLISNELEQLRLAGKTKSVRFKELMVKKLTNGNTIALLKSYGLQP